MNLKELFTKVKAVFDAPPVAPVAPVAPADTSNQTVYTLQDGTQIAIQQAGDTPAPGDMVTIAGAPAPEGMLVLQDGSAITCDATGAITLYTPVGGTPVTTPVPGDDAKQTPPPGAAAPAAPALPAKSPIPGMPGKSGYSEADKAALLAAFDTVGADDGAGLMSVLTICVKALMQSEFGWQIDQAKRLADTNAAITLYQTTLQASSQKFAAQQTVIAELKAENAKFKATFAGMFEFMEKLAELPTASPKTVTSARKDELEEAKKKTQDRFSKMADSLKTVKEAANA